MGKKIQAAFLCFLLIGLGVQLLAKEFKPDQWKEEVGAIDEAIERLSDLRDKELGRAIRRQNDGDRLQFQSRSLIDARRAWADADVSRKVAARYQEEIDELQLRKTEILHQHGIDYTPPSQQVE